MNAKFDIFVDSAANLTDETVRNTGIKVIPFTYTIEGNEGLCYDSQRPFAELAKEFYLKLAAGETIKTSLIGEQKFIEAVTPTLESGKDALIITITESLSGTYAQAVKAAATLKELFPERTVLVVDSANASLGEGMLAERAYSLSQCGESIEQCARWVEDNRYLVNSYVTVNDLKYLRRSGRVSAVSAIAGTILNIKPMLKADGKAPATLAVYSKERGRRKAVEALLKAFEENSEGFDGTVYIAHCNCEDEAEALAEELKRRGAEKTVVEYYDLCTGAHVGPGTMAVFFMGKDRRTPEEIKEHKRLLFLLRKARSRRK